MDFREGFVDRGKCTRVCYISRSTGHRLDNLPFFCSLLVVQAQETLRGIVYKRKGGPPFVFLPVFIRSCFEVQVQLCGCFTM